MPYYDRNRRRRGNSFGRSEVIPFEVPNLGKVGYDMQQAEDAKTERRENKTQQTENQLFSGMAKIPSNFADRKRFEDKLNEILEYSTEYNLNGDNGSYDKFMMASQELSAELNGVSAALTAQATMVNDYNINPLSYENSKEDVASMTDALYSTSTENGFWANPAQVAKVSKLMPVKRVQPSVYMSPNKALGIVPMDGVSEFIGYDANRGVTTMDKEGAYKRQYENTKRFAEIDKSLMISAGALYASMNKDEMGDGYNKNMYTRSNEEMVMNKMATSPEFRENALKMYSETLVDAYYDKKRDYKANRPYKPASTTPKKQPTYKGYTMSKYPDKNNRVMIEALLRSKGWGDDNDVDVDVSGLQLTMEKSGGVDGMGQPLKGIKLNVEKLIVSPNGEMKLVFDDGSDITGDKAKSFIEKKMGVLWQEIIPQLQGKYIDLGIYE